MAQRIMQFFYAFIFLFYLTSLQATNPTAYQKSYKVGDYAEGGVIFFLTPDGKHGLVASTIDISEGAQWGPPEVVGAKSNYIEFGENYTTAGKLNTQLIVDKYPDGSYAANLCKNYSVKMNGITYNDWYLPCLEELGLMMAMKETIESVSQGHGGDPFEDRPYWSSFEAFSSVACTQSFGDAGQYNEVKDDNFRVRAVRAF